MGSERLDRKRIYTRMKYKLIAVDMDGTLLNDRSELTERNKEAILKAMEAGVLFVVATGRPLSNTWQVNELFADDIPFIVLNGAAAYMSKSKKQLIEIYLDFDDAKEIFDIGQKIDIPQIVYSGPLMFTNKECERTLTYHKNSHGPPLKTINDLADIKDEVKGISKVLWIDDPARIKDLSVEMKAHFGTRLQCLSSLTHFLEFINNDAGKGQALAEIGKLYDIDNSEMIAVGDSYNDICMLEYAGFSVAVENAPDEVKSICDYVTLSNNDDGVAEVIDKLLLWNSLHEAE